MIPAPRWLKLAILAFVTAVAAAACLKYALFLYDGLDLAIYNQVMWKTVSGEPFGLTIHPHSYLGDHAEFLLMLLAPFYAFWLDPRMLLILQAMALGTGAWLLWQVVMARAAALGVGQAWARRSAGLVALLYLVSPVLSCIGLFEFHFLPFALLPLFAAALAYERGRITAFAAWLAAAVLVREDVALVVVVFGALAYLERRRWAWRTVPIAIGVAGFALGTAVTSLAGAGDGYKFASYYTWLGATPFAAVRAAFVHPLFVLGHVASLPNLELVLGLLMTVAFLPLLAPRRLVLAALPLLQFVLNTADGGELVLRTHYATLFLPALYLATAEALLALPAYRLPRWLRQMLGRGGRLPFDRRDAARLAPYVLGVIIVWNLAVLGPWLGLAAAVADPVTRGRARLAAAAVAAVPADAGVAASYSLLPALSGRDACYSLHYVFFGTTQFGAAPYPPPEDLTHVALDADDLLTWRAQARLTDWMAPGYADGRSRLALLIGPALWSDGPFAVYPRREELLPSWITPAETAMPELRGDVRVAVERGAAGLKEAVVTATWSRPRGAEDFTALITVHDEAGRVWHQLSYPLLGLAPQSSETADGLTVRLALPVEDLAPGSYRVRVDLERRAEVMHLGPALNTVRDGVTEAGWQAPDRGWPLTIQ
jgi:uncharacterized membrane protein